MEGWLRNSLSKCLQTDITDKMMKSILSIKNDEEFDDYFQNLLSDDDEEHRLFLLNCRRMLLSGKQPRNNNNNAQSKGAAPVKSPTKQLSVPQKSNAGTVKKQNKYVNLYANDGKMDGNTILLKGRRICNCQASKHTLVNNCLSCGRIVCVQEGSGPCLFCGEHVYTQEEEQQMAKSAGRTNVQPNSKAQKKQSAQVVEKSPNKENSAALQNALAQRDRLLEYDRNSEKRTTVIDDEMDYFQENSVWLTSEEREKFQRLKDEMHEMKHGSRMNRKIKVDFAGREVQDELPISKEYEENLLRELNATSKAAADTAASLTGHSSLNLPSNLGIATAPVYYFSKDKKGAASQQIHDGLERQYNRVQDKELLEMQDMRQCLSMHQPWASLLIAGIKKHEGRVWYSSHRGRLWIASTAREPHADEIADLEQHYRQMYNDPDLKMPEHYPAGSLLGCVQLENCLPQEEYRELYPNGESDSPYVFICKHAEKLPLLLPVQGEHKIYELPLKTHNAACKTLLRAQTTKP